MDIRTLGLVIILILGGSSAARALPPNPSVPCPADVNGDFRVDLDDLLVVLANFGCGPTPGCPGGDLDGSGTVDLDDLLIVLNAFGLDCCPHDLDGDLDIDFDDLLIVTGNFGCTTPPGCPGGDTDGDGDVDLDDMLGVLGDLDTACDVVLGAVDLDIDSNNSNGTGQPDRSEAEDILETDAPGKFILVNDDDDDFDGLADLSEPGSTPAERDDLVPLVLEITPPPGGPGVVDFRFESPSAGVRIWRAATRGVPGADDVAFQSPQSYTVANGPITFWVEALAPSTAAGDVTIAVAADLDDDGVFDAADAVRVTQVAWSQGPAGGGFGTAITWDLSPAVAPVAFGSGVSGSWTGRYEPLTGDPSAAFTIVQANTDVLEQSAAQAKFIAGSGSFAGGCPNFGQTPGGVLRGHQTLAFGGLGLTRSSTFATALRGNFHKLDYPEGGGGLLPGTPGLGDVVNPAPFGTVGIPGFPDDLWFIETPNSFHYAYALKLDDTPDLAGADLTRTIKLVSRTTEGVLLDEMTLLLTEVLDDGDPNFRTIASDRDHPLVLIEGPINKAAYPLVRILSVVPFGSVSATCAE